MKNRPSNHICMYGSNIEYVYDMLFELERMSFEEGYVFASYLMGLARTELEEKHRELSGIES